MSLLSWERGLKYVNHPLKNPRNKVAPLVGAWIEINVTVPEVTKPAVAPLVGAWIEIFNAQKKCNP